LEFQTDLVLLAVRNPLDVFVSHFQLAATFTHTLSIKNNLTDAEIKPFWDLWFETEL
jgi:hypothetical protein